MRHIRRPASLQALLALTSVVLLLSLPLDVMAESFSGKVIEVVDGDTIIVLDEPHQHKVKLLGIDAPENRQPYGPESQAMLAELIAGETVVVAFTERDKQKRLIGKVIFKGQDVSYLQLQHGMAWSYQHHQKLQEAEDRSLYVHTEKLARKLKIGLWADKWPQAPWAFRKKAEIQRKAAIKSKAAHSQ
ncbi:thermonuclease family protein [Methylobacillus glycogenes]|uniref:thermonuclease family protein n=1 Tax=Methylobacillus glycogenes TaxID=406 RepID=UPI00068675A2|nr:thermonuclease family protein [Methylobacillus glycogenes]